MKNRVLENRILEHLKNQPEMKDEFKKIEIAVLGEERKELRKCAEVISSLMPDLFLSALSNLIAQDKVSVDNEMKYCELVKSE